MTYDQFWERLQGKLRKFVLRILREEGVYNELMWPDGKVAAVSTDGKTADVYINGATTATQAIPIANGLLVAVNDEVIILNRSKMRDMVVKYRKTTATGPENIISAFRAYQSTAQSMTAGVWTKVSFQTKVFDNQTEYDATVYRFTAKNAGIYNVTNSIQVNAPASGTTIAEAIYKNGSLDCTIHYDTTSSASHYSAHGGAEIKLNAGDYLEIYYYSSVATTLLASTTGVYVMITKIA